MRPDLFASHSWRCYARGQTDICSTHRVPDPRACARRVAALAAAVRTSYRSAGPGDTDCTGGSRSAAGLLDDRRAARSRRGSRYSAAWSCDRGTDAARIPMHLFGAGNLDRVVGYRILVQLRSREPVRARPVRQLPAERERPVAVHTARGDPPRAAAAADLQRDGVHATHAGGNFGRPKHPPAALAGTAFGQSMLAMRMQLTRASRLLFSDLREPAPSP